MNQPSLRFGERNNLDNAIDLHPTAAVKASRKDTKSSMKITPQVFYLKGRFPAADDYSAVAVQPGRYRRHLGVSVFSPRRQPAVVMLNEKAFRGSDIHWYKLRDEGLFGA